MKFKGRAVSVLTLVIGLMTLNAMAEDRIQSINNCREAYAKFLNSDMRFSGSAAEVVGACQATLKDTESRQLLSKALTECYRKSPSLTSDLDVDREASVRRNKCTAGKAHDLAIERARTQKQAGFIEDCLKSGKSRTDCLETLTGDASGEKRIKEASLIMPASSGGAY